MLRSSRSLRSILCRPALCYKAFVCPSPYYFPRQDLHNRLPIPFAIQRLHKVLPGTTWYPILRRTTKLVTKTLSYFVLPRSPVHAHQSPRSAPPYMFHTSRSTPHTSQPLRSALHTSSSSPRSKPYASHATLLAHAARGTLHAANSPLHTPHSTLHAEFATLHIALHTQHCALCASRSMFHTSSTFHRLQVTL